MKTAQLAGHDDTIPATLTMDLQLFAEGEGGTGDAGGTENVDGAGSTSNSVSGNTGDPESGSNESANVDGSGAAGDKAAEGKATDEEGKPAAPDKYDIAVPDGFTVDETQLNEFTGVAKELGLNNDQANKLVGMHTKVMTDAFQALNEARNQEVVGWGEAAKTELGKDYDATLTNVALGMQAVEREIPSLREAMDKTGFGNTLEGIRLMAAVGKLLGEDQGGKDAGGRGAGVSGPLYSDMASFRK